jgi:hypothetical protein
LFGNLLSNATCTATKRGRAEKEGEVALAKMNELVALRRSLVMERERRDAVAAGLYSCCIQLTLSLKAPGFNR